MDRSLLALGDVSPGEAVVIGRTGERARILRQRGEWTEVEALVERDAAHFLPSSERIVVLPRRSA